MEAQQSASEPAQPAPGGGQVQVPDIPDPDMLSPLHPEAPGPAYRAQVVATGSDQVRSYLAGRGMPDEEIAGLLAVASRAGAVTVPETPEPGRPADRLSLSLAGSTWQLTIQGPRSRRPGDTDAHPPGQRR